MRIIKVLVALPMILLFGTLRFAVNIISKIYCRAASLVFVPMIILLILSVIPVNLSVLLVESFHRIMICSKCILTAF